MAHFPAPPLSPNNQRSPSRESGSPRSPQSTSARCCDTGRPLFTDPITGHTVCSCQYHDMLAYQRLPALYPAPYPPEVAAYFPAAAAAAAASLPDQPPFYTAGVGLDVKDGLPGAAPGWPYPSVYHPYDAAFAGYPFNGYGMDLNGARRKNATRETTSTLKAWLNEHKKNPYPTKGEKIMLAIITKMTLTQVSTWFANARRRLKKENKMTWEPRNRVDEEDNNNEESPPPRSKDETKDNLDSKDSGTASSEDGERTSGGRLEVGGGDTPTGTESWSESRPDSPECLFLQPGYPRYSPPAPKPRIWSLADMAKPDSPRRPQRAFPYPPVPPGLYSRVTAAAAAHSSSSVAAVVAAAAAAAGFPSSSSQDHKPETRA